MRCHVPWALLYFLGCTSDESYCIFWGLLSWLLLKKISTSKQTLTEYSYFRELCVRGYKGGSGRAPIAKSYSCHCGSLSILEGSEGILCVNRALSKWRHIIPKGKEENIHLPSISVETAKYPEAQELPMIHSCQEHWPWTASFFLRQHPQEESYSLKWSASCLTKRGEQTASWLCTVLLSFQMDAVLWSESHIYKNSTFMMEFYIIWLFTCQGWECKHFHSQKNFSMEMDPHPLLPCRGGLKNTRAPLNALYRSPCGTGKKSCKLNPKQM